MTREEVKKHCGISLSNEFDFDKLIDSIYDDFESRLAELEATIQAQNVMLSDKEMWIRGLEAELKRVKRINN